MPPLLLHTVSRRRAPCRRHRCHGELPLLPPGTGQPPWRPGVQTHYTVAPALRLHGTRWLSGVPAGLTPASRDAAASAHALTCNADADVLLVLSNDGHSTVVVVAAAPPLFPLEQSDHGLRLHPLMHGAESVAGAGWAPHGRLPRPERARAVLEGSGGEVPRVLGQRARLPPPNPSAMALAASTSRSRARARLPEKDDRVLARSGPYESNPTAKRVLGVDGI